MNAHRSRGRGGRGCGTFDGYSVAEKIIRFGGGFGAAGRTMNRGGHPSMHGFDFELEFRATIAKQLDFHRRFVELETLARSKHSSARLARDFGGDDFHVVRNYLIR